MSSTFNWLRLIGAVGFVISAANAQTSSSCPSLTVASEGEPVGQTKNVSGIQTYVTPAPSNQTDNAILYISDIFGLPLLENRLLADSIARSNHFVVLPDLFRGDAVPSTALEGSSNFDMNTWREKHPVSDVDAIVSSTIDYMRKELGVKKIGAVGYCFGGKYVPRFLAQGKGIDVGFIAHPSMLEDVEIQGIAGPLSIAAGDLDQAFNATLRHEAEEILFQNNATYQINLYAGAPHGFAVRANMTDPKQKFAKESALYQAVRWLETWL